MTNKISAGDILLPAYVLAEKIRNHLLSSRALLEAYLQQVDTLNGQLNAVVTLDVDQARKRADELDVLAKSGIFLGPLHGLPITVKDTLETKGIRTTAGAVELSEYIPTRNATAVQRVIDAGALVFGKTNVPTYAADLQSYNPIFGASTNPWDINRTPGGSSGGAAAAVASGLTAFEIGSDIGGSIRTPAHFCGIYGIKPTYGIIPLTGHIPGPPGLLSQPDIATVGPLARSATDLSLILNIMSDQGNTRSPFDPCPLPSPKRQHLSQYRVGVWLNDAAYPVDKAVRKGLETTVRKLRKKGVTVIEDARPEFSLAEAMDIYLQLLLPIFAEGDGSTAHVNIELPIAKKWETYPNLLHKQWMAANEARHRLMSAWNSLFEKVDVLLCPPNPITAPVHDHSEPVHHRTISINGTPRPYVDQFSWVGALAGVAHLPAAVAPVGLSEAGLPTGVQIIGPRYGDHSVIHFATQIEKEIWGYLPPPILQQGR